MAHEVLRDFCAALSSCRRELGDEASTDDWRRFIRPIWKFHNLAVAAPLPLSHTALLGSEAEQEIKREANRVRSRLPSVGGLVDRICEALSACRRSDLDPLGDSLRALLPGSTHVVLSPYDDEDVLSAIYQAGAVPADSIISRSHQRGQSQFLRRGLPLVVLGKLANIDPVLFRAPLADYTVHALLYDWVRDMRVSQIAGPLLSELGPRRPYAVQFARFFDDDGPPEGASSGLRDQSPLTSQYEAAVEEERPFVLPDIDLLEIPLGNRPHSVGDDTAAVVLVLADEGPNRKAIILEVDQPVLVLRRSHTAVEVRAADVVKGDLYVHTEGLPHHDLIEATAHDWLVKKGQLHGLMKLQNQWKASLRDMVSRLGIDAVTRGVAAHCEGWEPGADRIAEWVRDFRIGPQRKQAFSALCRFLQIPEEQAKEHWCAMRAIHNAHVKVGKDLSQDFSTSVVARLRAGRVRGDGPSNISVAGRAATVYPVASVSPRMITVSRSTVGSVFSVGSNWNRWAEGAWA